jgi:hypothetical protein
VKRVLFLFLVVEEHADVVLARHHHHGTQIARGGRSRPIFIPALLAMVRATTSILTGDGDPMLWIKLLLGYDIIFTTVSLLLFDVVFHAD